MKKGREGTALQPATPQGDAQGWSDDDDDDGGHRADGVQFAQSQQTTPGKHYDFHIVTFDISQNISPILSSVISRTSLLWPPPSACVGPLPPHHLPGL